MSAEPVVRRRHVFYVEGYDPQGAKGYYRLFERECKRFVTTWPVTCRVGELVLDSDDVAHWDLSTSGPNWQVETRYEFLRMERLIRGNMGEPLRRQIPRALAWMAGDVASGALLRIFRASWRFGLHIVYPQLMLIAWILVAAAGGAIAANVAGDLAGLPAVVAVLLGLAAALAVFLALRPIADRMRVLQITNGWPYLREFSRGMAGGYDHFVELYAARIVAAAQAGEADEIIIVGHSAGGVTSVAIAARALALDPDLGRRGPAVSLMTVGSLMPAFAMHPQAERLRAAVRRLAVDPHLTWIDCQAHKDVMNFFNFDPVAGVGVDAGPQRRNPIVWAVRLRDMIGPAFYDKMRFNLLRIHYQFIMANDLRAHYDYFLVVCGPVPVVKRAQASREELRAFAADAAYAPRQAARELTSPVPGE
jgi:hypothetical protein